MVTHSIKSIDVGFSLRDTGTPIDVPASIGTPSEQWHLETDEGVISGRACDIGSRLRKLGYTVTPTWFEGRSQWEARGREVIDRCGQHDRDIFERYTALAEAEKAEADRG